LHFEEEEEGGGGGEKQHHVVEGNKLELNYLLVDIQTDKHLNSCATEVWLYKILILKHMCSYSDVTQNRRMNIHSKKKFFLHPTIVSFIPFILGTLYMCVS